MDTFKVKKSKRHSKGGDEKLFHSSTTDNDKVNTSTSNAVVNDLECTGHSLQEPKSFQPKVDSDDELFNDSDDELFDDCNEKSRKKLLSNNFSTGTQINGKETIKHARKVGLKESHLLSSNLNKIKCDMCERCFNNTTKLLAHKKIHTITPSISLIDSTTNNKDMQSDMKMPRISANFQCPICSYEAKQRGTLNRHLRVHSEERRFSCKFCTYRTRHKCTLETHTKSHLEIRDYECELCLKKFLTNQNLKVHQLIHTGERPHVCELCGQTFVQLQHLYTHYTRMH